MSPAVPSARRRTGGWWVRLVVITAVAVVAVGVALRPTPTPAFTAQGTPVVLPDPGVLTTAGGVEFEGMLVGLRGSPVIVNVWASWCVPCRSEAPLLARAAREQSEVTIIGVSSKDRADPARRFMDDFDMRYVNVFDASSEIRRRLDVRGFPTTFVFDRDGKLVSTLYGGLTERSLAGAIDRVS